MRALVKSSALYMEYGTIWNTASVSVQNDKLHRLMKANKQAAHWGEMEGGVKDFTAY
jgi:hypothetical protein